MKGKTYRLLFGCLLVAALASISLAKIMDPRSSGHPLLLALADDLDRDGIDVRLGAAADHFSGERHQLTLLSNIPLGEDWTDLPKTGGFQELFEAGAFHGPSLLAIGDNGISPSGKALDFNVKWDEAQAEHRIFISISGQDLEPALALQDTLQKQGYSVFLYRNHNSDLNVDGKTLGRYFASAGLRLILDSPAARESRAVRVEIAANTILGRGKNGLFARTDVPELLKALSETGHAVPASTRGGPVKEIAGKVLIPNESQISRWLDPPTEPELKQEGRNARGRLDQTVKKSGGRPEIRRR